MRNRAFGVELEFDSNGLGRDGVLNVLRSSFERAGERFWFFSERLDWDGSEFELKTPILRGKEGFKKLQLVMDSLARAGCDCNSEDGMHVHHDAPEFVNNIDNCIRIVKSWKRNKHLIYQFVNEDRYEPWHNWNTGETKDQNVYWACPEWSDEALRRMEMDRQIPGWDRNDINLTSLLKHGTIEFRLHEGTLNYFEAEAWIQFGQRFIDRVLAHSMYDSKTPEKLLKKVQINPLAEKRLLNKTKWR